jgi:hypothetical protein
MHKWSFYDVKDNHEAHLCTLLFWYLSVADGSSWTFIYLPMVVGTSTLAAAAMADFVAMRSSMMKRIISTSSAKQLHVTAIDKKMTASGE